MVLVFDGVFDFVLEFASEFLDDGEVLVSEGDFAGDFDGSFGFAHDAIDEVLGGGESDAFVLGVDEVSHAGDGVHGVSADLGFELADDFRSAFGVIDLAFFEGHIFRPCLG